MIGLAVVTGIVTLSMRSKQHLMAVAVSGAILVGAVAIMWQVVQPYDLYVRFFVSAMPLVAALAGFGVARLPRPAQVVVVIAMVWALLPGALEVLDSQPRTREAAALVNIVRAEGLEVCGSNAEPLFVYTSPFPQVSDNGDLASCDVYVSVLGLGAEQRPPGHQIRGPHNAAWWDHHLGRQRGDRPTRTQWKGPRELNARIWPAPVSG